MSRRTLRTALIAFLAFVVGWVAGLVGMANLQHNLVSHGEDRTQYEDSWLVLPALPGYFLASWIEPLDRDFSQPNLVGADKFISAKQVAWFDRAAWLNAVIWAVLAAGIYGVERGLREHRKQTLREVSA